MTAVVVVDDAPARLRGPPRLGGPVPVAGISSTDGTLLGALAGRRGTFSLRSRTAGEPFDRR